MVVCYRNRREVDDAMRLVLQEFLSLDGVAQGPGAPDEDPTGGFTRGGWFVPFVDEAFLAMAAAWTGRADAFLFGRRTYEAFGRDWPDAPDPSDPVAAALNGLPKYVASHTLTEATWEPATILSGDVAGQVAELKGQPGGELQIHGSARLGHAMLAAGLVDELRLAVAPVIVGTGRRLFPDGAPATGLRLVRAEPTPAGLAVLTYEVAGPPTFETYRL
jgi:dihydrofolate reductase